jgi:HK97 family phage major capsid protein
MNQAHLLAATALSPSGSIFAMVASVDELREQITALTEESEGILATAEERGDGPTEEELGTIEANAKKAQSLARQLKAREIMAAATTGPGRRSAAEPTDPSDPNARTKIAPQARANDPKHGYKSFGEQAQVIMRAARGHGDSMSRLQNVATTYGNEGVGADGGFSVAPEFRRDIWQKVMDQENLLTRCSPLTTGGNSITIPKDETTPWQAAGGVQVYWEAEAAAATASKPALEMSIMRLNKLMALVPVSDELLEDAPGLESWLRAKAPQKMAAKINTAIVRGTGAGQPLGVLNAGCLVTVAAEAGQLADTVYFGNIVKIWGRVWSGSRRNGIWLINQDIEQQLYAMAFDPAATSKVPVYLGPNGLADSPYGTLMGRPVVPVEACSTLGDKGDIIFADLTQYWALTKGSDVRSDVSMHLYFDQGLTSFRFTFRVNGQPAWGSTVTPENGSATRSPFVTVAERTL